MNVNKSIWEGMLRAGVPAEHVCAQIERHIEALELLNTHGSGDTSPEEIAAEIKASRDYLTSIQQ